MNEYEEGTCSMCLLDTQVRWKNLYLTGSEGVTLCLQCELELLHLMRKKRNEASREKIKNVNAIQRPTEVDPGTKKVDPNEIG